MLPAFYVLLFLILSIVIYQDFCHRGISWIIFPSLLVVCCICRFLISPSNFGLDPVINCAFLLIQISLLHVYFLIKQKRIVKITNVYLGLGDILFLLSISPLFSLISYLVFYVLSLFVTLIASLVYISVTKKQLLIPLAGFQAIVLLVVIVSLIALRRTDLMTFDILLIS